MTDAEFLTAFETCALPREGWTHRAHVRMAWLYLGRMPLVEARPIVREGIRRYNATLDKPLAYHETITQAYLTIIAARREPGEPFDAFCARSEDLLDGRLGALLAHYRQETLHSAEARENFVLPDLAEFPAAG